MLQYILVSYCKKKKWTWHCELGQTGSLKVTKTHCCSNKRVNQGDSQGNWKLWKLGCLHYWRVLACGRVLLQKFARRQSALPFLAKFSQGIIRRRRRGVNNLLVSACTTFHNQFILESGPHGCQEAHRTHPLNKALSFILSHSFQLQDRLVRACVLTGSVRVRKR